MRELFTIDRADYMLAICGSDALRELSSPGKSGSLFYMTQDDRFMIKTVRKSEVKVSYPPFLTDVSHNLGAMLTNMKILFKWMDIGFKISIPTPSFV